MSTSIERSAAHAGLRRNDTVYQSGARLFSMRRKGHATAVRPYPYRPITRERGSVDLFSRRLFLSAELLQPHLPDRCDVIGVQIDAGP